MKEIQIKEKSCYFYQKGNGGPLLILGSHHFEKNDELVCEIEKRTEKDFSLLVFMVDDWDSDFSIWPYVFSKDRIFSGNGSKTLQRIANEIIPYLKENGFDYHHIYMAGYSLAGLFSLWSIYQTDAFDGCISCSGSLWFKDFLNFITENKVKNKSLVYLSVGGKENKTNDSVISTILDKTKETYEIIKKDQNVVQCKLEYNSGGHFGNSNIRLAKGMAWIIENGQ